MIYKEKKSHTNFINIKLKHARIKMVKYSIHVLRQVKGVSTLCKSYLKQEKKIMIINTKKNFH